MNKRSFLKVLTACVVASAVEVLGWKRPVVGDADLPKTQAKVAEADYWGLEAQRILEMLEGGIVRGQTVWKGVVRTDGYEPVWDWTGDYWKLRERNIS